MDSIASGKGRAQRYSFHTAKLPEVSVLETMLTNCFRERLGVREPLLMERDELRLGAGHRSAI
jgi:hypothetical protein